MLINDLAESKITVNKDELLTTLRTNLEQHKKDYLEAQAGFREAFQAKLKQHLAILETAETPPLNIVLTVPVSYAKEYDRAIRMLEMCLADQIVISEHQFTQYVMDEWNWKGSFSSTVASYSKSAR